MCKQPRYAGNRDENRPAPRTANLQYSVRQVLAFIQAGRQALGINPLQIAEKEAFGIDVAAEALAWADPLLRQGACLFIRRLIRRRSRWYRAAWV